VEITPQPRTGINYVDITPRPRTGINYVEITPRPCTGSINGSKKIYGCTFFVVSGTDVVTCGSVLKLVNVRSDVRLHSHDIKYGSGSGQQVGR